MNEANADWPTELSVDKARANLAVTFESGERFLLAAEYLRVESPSAEVQGHSAAQKQVIGGKRSVKIDGVDPVGNYAVRIRFDDGHDTGLFSWSYLKELGREHRKRWDLYLKALKEKHLARE